MKVRWKPFLRRFLKEVDSDRIMDVAAMMTYYAVFALFPMLVFVVTITLLVAPGEWIDGMVDLAGGAMPPAVTELLREQIDRMKEAAGAGFAIGAAGLALWGASRGANSLMGALNDMYEKVESRGWIKRQLIAIGTTLVVAALLVVAMALLAIGPTAGHAFAERFGLGGAFDVGWGIFRWAFAAFLVMLTWAILYKWLPDVKAPFRIFTPGAVVGVLLWFGITQGFAFYLDNFGSYEKTYGAVASVIIFMTWLWLSNLALLGGAEINDVLADLRKDKSPAAAALAEREKSPHEKAGSSDVKIAAAEKKSSDGDAAPVATKSAAVAPAPTEHPDVVKVNDDGGGAEGHHEPRSPWKYLSGDDRHAIAEARRTAAERNLGLDLADRTDDHAPVFIPAETSRPNGHNSGNHSPV